jgi:transcriptional regulator with XRE-family HTH domain
VPRSVLNPVDKHVGSRVRMRRLMLEMSQSDLADGLGLTFQQVQKYEKGANRIGASRLQQISLILQVSVPFFFDGVPGQSGATVEIADSDSYVNDFLASSDGLALVKAFMRIQDRNCAALLSTLLSKSRQKTVEARAMVNLSARSGSCRDKGERTLPAVILLKIEEAFTFPEQIQCDTMYVSDECAAVIYGRAWRAWYGKRAAHVVKKRIEELRRTGDIKGVAAWSQVADKLSQLDSAWRRP